MRNRRAFTLVEIMIVVLIIGILMAVAVPQWINARERSRVRSCMANLTRIDSSKAQWAMENNLPGSSVPTVTDLCPNFIKGGMPLCPTSGTYTINSVDTEAVCSVHGAASAFAP